MNDPHSVSWLNAPPTTPPRCVYPTTGTLPDLARSGEIQDVARRVVFLIRYQEGQIDHVRFGDHAWFALITLYLAKFEDKTVSVTELRDHMSLPMSSVQRLVQYLLSVGLIQREKDATDGRRFNLTLKDAAEIALERQLSFLSRSTAISEDTETRNHAQQN